MNRSLKMNQEELLRAWADKQIAEVFDAGGTLQRQLAEVARRMEQGDDGIAYCIATLDPEANRLVVECVTSRLQNRIPLAAQVNRRGPTASSFNNCLTYVGPVLQELGHSLGPGLNSQCSVPIFREGQALGIIIAYHSATDAFAGERRKKIEEIAGSIYTQLRARLLRERFVRVEPVLICNLR